MGWFAPCCCAPPTEEELVVCTACFNDRAPPIWCVEASGFTNGTQNCVDGLNGKFFLSYVGAGVIAVGDAVPCLGLGGATISACEWKCDALGESGGVLGTDGSGGYPDAKVFIYGCSSGIWRIRVAFGVGAGVGGACVFQRDYASKPDCRNFSGEVIPYLNGCTPNCGVAAPPEIRLTAIGRTGHGSDCCYSPACYAARMPRYVMLTLEGFESINANCRCSAADCLALNGTYLLEAGLNCSGAARPVFGACTWVAPVTQNCSNIRCLYLGMNNPGFLFFVDNASTIRWVLDIRPIPADFLCDIWNFTTGIPNAAFPGSCFLLGQETNPPLLSAFCSGTLAVPGGNGVRVTVQGVSPRLCV